MRSIPINEKTAALDESDGLILFTDVTSINPIRKDKVDDLYCIDYPQSKLRG